MCYDTEQLEQVFTIINTIYWTNEQAFKAVALIIKINYF